MCSMCTVLCSYPVVALHFTEPFQIESDVSNTALGSILTQEHIYFHKTIAFLSNTLANYKKNYSVHDHSLLAIIPYCKAWCPYIDRQ